MAKEEYVWVELIANPTRKRQMTPNSLKSNSAKWRLSEGGENEKQAPELKKKDVAPVEIKSTEGAIATLPVKAEPVADPELDQLRADYLAKTGKPADKRMKKDKLKSLIDAN